MNIREAINNGVPRVRLRAWNEYAHLLIRPPGVWVKLIDPCSNLALGKTADHTDNFPSAFVASEDYVAWPQPSNYVERFGEPPDWAESATAPPEGKGNE